MSICENVGQCQKWAPFKWQSQQFDIDIRSVAVNNGKKEMREHSLGNYIDNNNFPFQISSGTKQSGFFTLHLPIVIISSAQVLWNDQRAPPLNRNYRAQQTEFGDGSTCWRQRY